MGITTDLNNGPYYDDFEGAEAKNYHRVLFKPATAVQARELTQLQSILQDQIEKFGKNILVDGTIIKGGNFVEHVPLPYVKILDRDTDNRPVVMSNYVGLTARGDTTGVLAKVVAVAEGFQTQTDTNTLYLSYISAGTQQTAGGEDNVDTFSPTENISLFAGDPDGNGQLVTTVVAGQSRISNAIGYGYGVSCGDGIIFQKGHFINFSNQLIIVSRYDTQPSGVVIGFEVTEELINSYTDPDLFDNALGFANYNAPGADRLKLTPTLVTASVTDARNNSNFFILQEYNSGKVVRTNTRTKYNTLGKEMARRTYEESGNYALEPFTITVEDFADVQAYPDVRNLGSDYVTLKVSPGLAYVEGERVELINEYKTTIDKSKDSLNQPQQNISLGYGNYIDVEDYVGTFKTVGEFATVNLHGVAHTWDLDANPSNIPESYDDIGLVNSGATGDALNYITGRARIRSIENLTNGKVRLYLFDICMTCGVSGEFENVKSISHVVGTDVSVANVILNSSGQAVLRDTASRPSLYNLGRGFIKSVARSGTRDYVYREYRSIGSDDVVSNSFSISGFGNNSPYIQRSGAWTDSEKQSLLITNKKNGQVIPIDNYAVTSNSTAISVAVDTVANGGVDIGYDPDPLIQTGGVDVYFDLKTSSTINPIGKDVVTGLMIVQANTHASPSDGQFSLGIPDVISIENIYYGTGGVTDWASEDLTVPSTVGSGTVNVTKQYTLFNNQKDTHYDYSYIKRRPAGPNLADNDFLIVEYKAFRKNTTSASFNNTSYEFSQSFFSIDSYYSIPVEEIPTFTSEDGQVYNLRDTVDFRPYVESVIPYILTSINGAVPSTLPAPAYEAGMIVDTEVTALSRGASFGSTSLKFPSHDSILEADFDYYLGRIDKVYITEKGQVEVLRGKPSENPKMPDDPSTGMVIGTIHIPPYPSLPGSTANKLQHPEYAIATTRPSPRRYTMADIGKIDNRVKAIEYYTVLNTLEKDANEKFVPDNTGNDRFKNGIFVDSFNDFKTANTKSPEFAASIDPTLKEIGPRIRQFYLDLEVANTTNVVTVDNADAMTLAFTSTPFMTQPYATNEKSCTTDFYNYNGTMFIYPEYDGGAETSYAPDMHFPDIDIAGAFIDFTEVLNETVPFQRTVTDVATTTTTTQLGGSSSTNLSVSPTTVTRTNFLTTTATTTLAAATQIDVTEEITTQKVGDFVTDVRFLPFMRSRDIEIEIFGMMPNKRVYFYFDKKPVNVHMAKAERVDGQKRLVRSTKFGASNKIYSDSTGVVRAIFRIPENTFYVGDRDLEVASSLAYTDIQSATTYAKKTYRAFNFNVEKTSAFVTTRTPSFNSSTAVTETTRTDTDSWTLTQTNREADLQRQINDAVSQIAANQEAIAENRRLIDQNTDNINSIQTRVTINENSIAINNAAIEDLQSQVDQNTQNIATNTASIAANEATIADLENELATNTELTQQEIDDLNNQIDALENVNTGLANDIAALEADTIANQTNINTLTADVQGLDQIVTNQIAQILALETEIGDATDDISALEQEIRDNPTIVNNITNIDIDITQNINITNVFNNWWWWWGWGGGGTDPIAQTFYVEPDTSIDDTIQLTAIDVYFSGKSSRGNGVTVQIVDTVNGYPGKNVVPFGEVHKTVEEVFVNDTTGTTPTTFTFPAPVTLRTGRDYAVIIQPDGNDPDYFVWISKTGGVDVSSTTDNPLAVTQDTNSGVLFTSTNKKAWTPYQDENLKFTLYKASFSEQNGSIKFTNKDDEFFTMEETKQVGRFKREEIAFKDGDFSQNIGINVVEGSRTITAGAQSDISTIQTGDKIAIEIGGAESERYEVFTVTNKNGTDITVSEIPTFTDAGARWIRTVAGKVSFYNVSASDNETTLFLTDSSATSTTFSFAAGDTIIGTDSNARGQIKSVDVQPISKMLTNIYKTNSSLTGTSLKASKLYDIETDSYFERDITMNAEQHLYDKKVGIKSRSLEITQSAGVKSFELELTLSAAAGNDGTVDSSPFIDYDICNVLAFQYLINNDTTKETIGEGAAKSKYVSKTIKLADDQNSGDFKIYLTAYRPPNTDIKVYAKFINQADTRPVGTIEWTELEAIRGGNLVSSITNRNDWKEIEYGIPSATATTPGGGAVKLNGADDLTYETPVGSVYNSYKYFAIKIVFLGDSHAAVPRVNNFRSIALANGGT